MQKTILDIFKKNRKTLLTGKVHVNLGYVSDDKTVVICLKNSSISFEPDLSTAKTDSRHFPTLIRYAETYNLISPEGRLFLPSRFQL